MRITLLTPLFPPDTGNPAPYVKMLAAQMPAGSVDLVLYGHLPEHVPHIRYHCIDKRSILPMRLFRFTKTLHTLSKKTDVLLVQNGPSVELPALLISYISRTPIVLCISDARAYTKAQNSKLYGIIHRMLYKRAVAIIAVIQLNNSKIQTILTPLSRPDILPFGKNDNLLKEYEKTWKTHINTMMNVLHHATK